MSLPGVRQLFRSFKRAAPSLPYDAEVKWLESTGTQFIDTGFVPRGDVSISCRFKWCDMERKYIYGVASDNLFGILGFGSGDSSGKFTWAPATTGRGTTVDSDMDWHDSEMSVVDQASSVTIDGIVNTTDAYLTLGATLTLKVFAREGISGTIYYKNCRIASFSIKDITTNQLLLDLVPVRFTNELGESEGAMYDKVSGQLLRNQGTGKFVVGADAGMPYDCEVQYLESSGTQYIDTGVYGGADLLYRTRYALTEAQSFSSAAVLFGNNVIETYHDSTTGASGTARIFTYVMSSRTGKWGYAAYTPGTTSTVDADRSWHSAVVDTANMAQKVSVDGTEVASWQYDAAEAHLGPVSGYTVKVFTGRSDLTLACVRFSSFSITRKTTEETLIDLVPVRFTNGQGVSEGAMYDRVSGNLFGNLGTGAFSTGSVVSNEGPVPYAYKVEYIETDGVASYIDTGVEFDPDVRLLFNLAFVGEYNSAGAAGNTAFNFTSGWTSFRCLSNYIAFTSFSFDTSGAVFHECEIQYFPGDKIAKVDGATVGTSTSTIAPSMPTGTTFVIGALNKDGSIINVGHVKCAKFQIFDHDGNCKFNGIPVVDRNGVACMYDYISKTLKYNAASTGTITAGPQV